MLDGATIAIVAFGTAARVSKTAIQWAREGRDRRRDAAPITLFPFPGGRCPNWRKGRRPARHRNEHRADAGGRSSVHPSSRPDRVSRKAVRDAHPRRRSSSASGCWQGGRDERFREGRIFKGGVHTAPSLVDVKSHFCPGCHPRTIHKIVTECIDRYDLREKTIGVACVGCSVFLYDYIDVDVVESPHGRAPAVATGVKRAQPDKFVFTYQGDGDLAAIGTSEIIHAANRGENLSVIFVNNTTYGMTGGQMAPRRSLRSEDLHHSVRTRFPLRRLPDPDGRTPARPRGDGLLRQGRGFHPQPRSGRLKNRSDRLRDADQRMGLSMRRIPLHLS